MFLLYVFIIQKKKSLQAAVCFHLMKFCHSVECCQVFQTSISFLFVFLLFSSMKPRFFKKQCFCFMCLIFSRIFYQQTLFCVFLPFNRMASNYVLPFCVYVIQQNGTQIIQATIFSNNIFLSSSFFVFLPFKKIAGSSFLCFWHLLKC